MRGAGPNGSRMVGLGALIPPYESRDLTEGVSVEDSARGIFDVVAEDQGPEHFVPDCLATRGVRLPEGEGQQHLDVPPATEAHARAGLALLAAVDEERLVPDDFVPVVATNLVDLAAAEDILL